jgi:hypothetical protein
VGRAGYVAGVVVEQVARRRADVVVGADRSVERPTLLSRSPPSPQSRRRAGRQCPHLPVEIAFTRMLFWPRSHARYQTDESSAPLATEARTAAAPGSDERPLRRVITDGLDIFVRHSHDELAALQPGCDRPAHGWIDPEL